MRFINAKGGAIMKKPLTHATEAELAHATQENLFALFRAMAHALPGGELVETDRLAYHHTFPTNPMFKGVWHTRFSMDEAEDRIDERSFGLSSARRPSSFGGRG